MANYEVQLGFLREDCREVLIYTPFGCLEYNASKVILFFFYSCEMGISSIGSQTLFHNEPVGSSVVLRLRSRERQVKAHTFLQAFIFLAFEKESKPSVLLNEQAARVSVENTNCREIPRRKRKVQPSFKLGCHFSIVPPHSKKSFFQDISRTFFLTIQISITTLLTFYFACFILGLHNMLHIYCYSNEHIPN